MSARLFIFGPIPSPSEWRISLDESGPPGYLRLASIAPPRAAAKNPRSDLSQDIEALPSQLERLLHAYARLDDAGRVEVIRHAEQLGGVV